MASGRALGGGSGDVGDTNRAPDARAQIAGLIFAVLLVDGEGRIAEVNQAAEILLGTSARRLVGQDLLALLGPLDPRVEKRLERTDEALVARELALTLRQSELQVNLTVSPLSGAPGWRVVTLSKIAHEDTASVENARESAPPGPSILAHEIKNPLSAIRGAAQLAARKLPQRDRPLARMITDEVDRIARLVDRMQQLGSTRSEPSEPLNPHEAIRSALATVRVASAGTKAGEGAFEVAFREEFDPSIPPVLANRDALEQVLINLLSNARDAAMEGARSPQVTIRTRYVHGLVFSAMRLGRPVKLPIEITVTDNGKGIDPALRGAVFEPFVSTKQHGQGLGLALVRKMVLDMGGSVTHERDARLGLTHFRIHLAQAPGRPPAKSQANPQPGGKG
ncbi:nitrogen regulation protein NR(II) [Erythrobacter sp. HL-111]|uniref:two-component system sensor histidine kinase NtrB n=1 Tax=Erythrobacter sp. HL-111 TaxID=1798193 RepID=UPI0006DA3320|nr:ATP-binding protein [Erythrobacter sp. HL-111]KPP85448.1 MAG: two-component system, NtrC family, nitrogen regulation sensor histidine kinase GlnL [Erythrobacteraceae bacterium HL-111]SDR97132.1 two-component system, NtrC family, nitrogen regulation sensor histidine kinase GlnL [Erythrobacter sp. HL-111]